LTARTRVFEKKRRALPLSLFTSAPDSQAKAAEKAGNFTLSNILF
jgi:hypothetical protein